MAKHIVFNNIGVAALVESDEAKDWWLNNNNAISSEVISDNDYEAVVYTLTKQINNQTGEITNNLSIPSHDFSKEMVRNLLNELIENVEYTIANYPSVPSTWPTIEQSLKNINLDSITWPVNAANWLDALNKNGITVPSPVGEIPCSPNK
jgi:hypothetical protein